MKRFPLDFLQFGYCIGAMVLFSMAAFSDTPLLKWSYAGQSNLYAPPLVAEMCPRPGLETVICDSEAKAMRCLDAQGKILWEYKPGWKRRLISAPALSKTNLLLIANGDGTLRCVDAATGAERWQQSPGPVEWGGALWADIDGDGEEEAVAGTASEGVSAYDAAGELRWRYQSDPPLEIGGPLAAKDIDDDKRMELFGAGKYGPFCLNPDGTLRWQTITGDEFLGSVVLGDRYATGVPALFSASQNDAFAWCFDARTDAILWRAALLGPADTYPASAIAVGDIDRNAYERYLTVDEMGPRTEMLLGDNQGHLHAINADGTLRWTFSASKPASITATLGDVDGDGQVEVLAASGDHCLYCLDRNGRLEWKYETGLRLIYPPTLADIDQDGKTDILVCGSDHQLRCLTLNGAYRPELMPWPSRRFDAAQRGAAFGYRSGAVHAVAETRSLLPQGGFEFGKTGGPNPEERAMLPRGWNAENTLENMPEIGLQPTGVPLEGWTRDTVKVREGKYALHTSAALRVSTEILPIDPGLREISGEVYAMGDSAGARLRWHSPSGMMREEVLSKSGENAGWQVYAAKSLLPNEYKISGLQLVLESGPGDTWWDAASLTGVFYQPPKLDVLINQVGYDSGAPKRFVVQSSLDVPEAVFALVCENEEVYRGALAAKGRITGHYGNDWGYNYWRGDFSDFDTPGNYRVRVELGGQTAHSYPFQINSNLLWNSTARPAYRFFYYQRCGMAIPGFHEACHLDDAVSPDGKTQHELWGGWHDAGDYNTYHNAPYVYGLLRAYGNVNELFDAEDQNGNGAGDFLDEIRWGAEHSRRMIASDGSAFGHISSGYGFWGPPELETDNIPGTGDERPIRGQEMGADPSLHLAAMARMATVAADKPEWVAAAQRSLQYSIEHKQRGIYQFSAAIDLFEATQDPQYETLARELLPNIAASAEIVDTVRRFDRLFREDHREALKAALVARADEILALADNPFGVYTYGTKENPNFFNTPADPNEWHVGTSTYLFDAANLVALAYQYAPEPRYLAFIYDQFNWTLGTNPFNVSLMEGCGSAFLPSYHHRYVFSGVPRGAVPGSVVNGFTWKTAGEDRPFLDLTGVDIPAFNSNECWLPHNTAYLNALVNLPGVRQNLSQSDAILSQTDVTAR